MLFVQQIEIEYRKNVRYANFAQMRNAIKFYPVKIDRAEMQQDVLFHSVKLYQDTDGMHDRGSKCRQYSEDQLFDGKFYRSPFGRKIAVKPLGEDQYEVHFYGGFDKTAFVLRKDQYGRIVFNERNTYYDTGEWYYQLFVFNFVCCERDCFREKLFFNKNPDYEFDGMKYLRYC